MMKSAAAFALLLALVWLTGCSSEHTPSYALPDNLSLRQYQGTEQANYVISGQYTGQDAPLSISGDITLTWQPNTATTAGISALQNKTLFTEQWRSNIVNYPPFFMERTFWQQDNGQLVYAGFRLSAQGEIYWAAPLNGSGPDAGIASLGAPTPEAPALLSYELWRCNNGVCSEKVANVTEGYQYLGIEKVETPYAVFDTLRYQYQLEIVGVASHPELNLRISGHSWIYPPLGPVKFSWLLFNDQGTTNFSLGLLTSTNIPLPPPSQ
ncbi:MAG: hypothetical protein OEW58_01840 [Gammaproteobacteria bacterium]|nr:hypothetical protein [Gammaproteobacteria bacterium]